MDNLNQSTQAPEVLEPVVSTMPAPVETAPLANKPLGMPGVNLDSNLANRVKQAPIMKKSSKLKILIIVLLSVFILGGGGAWAYFAFGQAWYLNQNANFPNWENYKENLSFSIKVHDLKGAAVENSASGDLFSLGGGQNWEEASLSFIHNNHQSGNKSNGQSKFIIGTNDFTYNFSVFFKKIDQDIYIKPELEQLEIPNVLNTPLDLGQEWIVFNIDDLVQWGNEMGASDAQKTIDEYLTDSKQKEEDFLNKVVAEKIFVFKDLHETKTTASGNIKKFEYKVAENKSDDLVNMMNELWYDKQMSPDMLSFLEKFLTSAKVSVWINTKTKFIQEVNVEAFNIALSDESGSAQFDFVLNYEVAEATPIELAKPEPVINWLDFSNRMMSQFMSPENYLPVDADADLSLDSDGDTLTDFMEQMYGTDVNQVDTDGDGYSDGEEVENGYNPLGPGRLETLQM